MKNCTFSVDVESLGPIPGIHAMVAVGASIVAPDLSVVSTFHSYVSIYKDGTPESGMYASDEDTIQNFWMRDENVENYHKTMEICMDPSTPTGEVVMDNMWSWLDQKIAENSLEDILPIGDCLPYDGRFIGHFSKRDIQKPFGPKYTEWTDVCSYYRGFARKPITTSLIDNTYSQSLAMSALRSMNPSKVYSFPDIVKHDHRPDNDATHVGQFFQWFRNEVFAIEAAKQAATQ